MAKEESSLEDFKKEYKELQKKYSLPSFDEMNKDFYIEKISEAETDYPIREVRKYVADKVANYLRFIESLLHPVSVPIFFYSVIKTLGNDEKEKLTEVYKSLAKCEIDLISLDIDFDEKREAEFVKKSFATWQKIKRDILEVLKVVEKKWDDKLESNGKGYFN